MSLKSFFEKLYCLRFPGVQLTGLHLDILTAKITVVVTLRKKTTTPGQKRFSLSPHPLFFGGGVIGFKTENRLLLPL